MTVARLDETPRPVTASPVRIAVLIPCYNEELTIAHVVSQFREQLPDATIYVFDNNSTDRTVSEAERSGAVVMYEPRQGKGNVVQTMFRRIKADVYVMVDGDDTYPPEAVGRLIAPIISGEADMVIGSRLHVSSNSEFRMLNRFGNRLFLWLLQRIFHRRVTDLLSGYRAFSRRFVSGTPLFAEGFDTEAEMTIRALAKETKIVEIPVDLVNRPTGSSSKIHVFRDGFLILRSMLALFRDYKPLSFFGSVGILLTFLASIPGTGVIVQYLRTGSILRMPSAILAVGLVLAGMLMGLVGVILHVIAQRFRELDFQLELLSQNVHRSNSNLRE